MFLRLFETPHKRARRLAAGLGWPVMEKSENRIIHETYASDAEDVLAQGGIGAFIDLWEREFASKRTIGDAQRAYALAEPVATLEYGDEDIAIGRAMLKLKLYEQAYEDSGHSPAAGAIFARGLFALGYLHRGTGWAHTVSKEGWDKLAQYTELAHDVFLKTASRADDCALWHRALFQIGISDGCSAEQLEDRFEHARAFDPAEHGLYTDRAYQLLPRWYGSFEELEEFAVASSRRTETELGGTLYARIYHAISRHEDLRDTDADWGRLKASMEAWYQTNRSQRLLNTFASMADLYDDHDVLRDLMETRIRAYFPDAWVAAEQAADVFSRMTPNR